MPEPAAKTELMCSLRSLIRGLSALFWGLPLSLVVCVQSAAQEWLKPLGILPPVFATGLLLYGLIQLGHFQKQERIWLAVLERAKLFALVNVGLSPFIYWWQKLPQVAFYTQAITILAVSGLLFVFNLNKVLRRLSAMLPDETLRTETALFTSMNLYLIIALMVLTLLYFALAQVDTLPQMLIDFLGLMSQARRLLVVVLVLIPLAMTMTLLWKIKEAVLASVFNQQT